MAHALDQMTQSWEGFTLHPSDPNLNDFLTGESVPLDPYIQKALDRATGDA